MPDTPKGVSIDELVKNHKVPTVAPPVPAPPQASDGETVIERNGRKLFVNLVDGQQIVTPKPLAQMSEQDFYDLPVNLIECSPGRLPQNLTVEFKDPHWAGYWFNRSAKSGARVPQAKSLGFIPAKAEDLAGCAIEINDQDGAVVQNDLVLMKIPKWKLYSQYKQWIDRAKVMGSPTGYKNAAQTDLNPSNRSADPFYLTKQAEKEYQGLGPVVPLPTVT